MNPDHLLEQAATLLTRPLHGPPRQANKRRAVSTIYYAVLHHLLRRLADHFVGVAQRGTPRYELLYRGLSHARAAKLCREAVKPQPQKLYAPYWPEAGFGAQLRVFCATFVELQEQRHDADYSSNFRINTEAVSTYVEQAREAIVSFERVDREELALFLTLLVSDPRG